MSSQDDRIMDASGKYVRYTNEQVEALERVYHECPKPSSIRRQQLIKDCPILAHIEPKQIKVWFQNRRCALPNNFLFSRPTSFQLKWICKLVLQISSDVGISGSSHCNLDRLSWLSGLQPSKHGC